MKFAATALLALGAAVAAQDTIDSLRAQIPACANTCLTKAAQAAGCTVGDYACSCGKRDVLTASATPCLLDPSSGCTTQDLGSMLPLSPFPYRGKHQRKLG